MFNLRLSTNTTQKMKFFIMDFFNKCNQSCWKLKVWSHLLKKSLIENFTLLYNVTTQKGVFRTLSSPCPAGIYLLNVNNRNTRTRYEICSKLTIKTPERRQWGRSNVFIVNFEQFHT